MKKSLGLLILAGLLGPSSGMATDGPLERFLVDSEAACPNEGLEAIPGSRKAGSAFIIPANTPLYRGASATAPETSRKVPPLSRVTCFGGIGTGKRYRVLVRADLGNAKGGTDKVCGWVDSAALLQQSDMSVTDPCPDIKERKVSDYYDEGPKHTSPLNLKLIVWNINIDPTAAATQRNQSKRPVIPAYDTPGGNKVRDVNIYRVFPVYDFTKQGEDEFFLIGANNGLLLGWIRGRDAVVWDNRLTLFFKEGRPNANIYYEVKQLTEAFRSKSAGKAFATPPADLAKALHNSRNAFPKFPVLADKTDATKYPVPYYDIAFIGNWCIGDRDCSSLDIASVGPAVDVGEKMHELEDADILFLLDATESMDTYFKAVAEAVKAATLGKYRGDKRIHIGAALYGDYSGKSKSPGGALQYRSAVPLTSIMDGNEMDELLAQSTFRDPNGDNPEASDGALLKAAKETAWREKGRRLIVHIGDHGPRQEAPADTVLKALQDQRVFYVPVAVAGSYSEPDNRAFVNAARNLLDAHKTAKGNRMGMPQVLVTYDPANVSKDVDETQKSVKRILDEGLGQAEQVSHAILNEIYALTGEAQAPTPAAPARAPDEVAAGFAKLTPALREIFGLEEEKIALIKNQGQLVSPGHVARYDPRDKQPQWDTFVAVDPDQMPLLESTIGSLCLAVSRSSAKDKLVSSIQTMTQSLSGDSIPDTQSLYEYLENVLQIPYSGPHVQDSFPSNLSNRAPVHRSGLALPQARRSRRSR